MWMMTKHGFFSVVEFRGEPQNLLIRARRRDHLEAVCKAFPEARGSEIQDTTSADYPFRMKVQRAAWRSIAYELVSEIDYPDFKSAVRKAGNEEYLRFLHSVWSVGHDIEEPRP